MKSLYPGMTKSTMQRTGGILALLVGRVHRQVFVSALGYQPGSINSNDDLRQLLSSAVSDFSLTATTGWPCPEPVGGAAVSGPTISDRVYAIAHQANSPEPHDPTA